MPLLAELDHLGLNSPDPARLAAFYSRAMGMESRPFEDTLVAQALDRRLIIGEGRAGTLRHAAFRLADEAARTALIDRLAGKNWPSAPVNSPFLSEAIGLDDPDGNRLIFGLAKTAAAPHFEGVANRPARLQHVVYGSRDAHRLASFHEQVLGFVPTDQVHDEHGGVRTTFLRSNHEHHSIAVFQTSQDRLDHCCYEAGNWDLIRDWADHMAEQRIPLKWGPGRHGPGNNLFIFVHDCDGNWVEISAELETVGPDRPLGTWPHEERTLNSWGIGLLRS